MRRLFWTIMFIIAVLVLAAMATFNNEEATVQLPPETVVLIDSLQHVTDAMYDVQLEMNEIKALALAAGRSSDANLWMAEVDKSFEEIKSLYNTHIVPVSKDLKGHSIPEASKSMIEDLEKRAGKTVSADAIREIFLAKKELGINVSSDMWNEITDELAARADKFDRNTGLRNLAEYVSGFDAGMAGFIKERMDAPFVIEMGNIKNSPESVNIDEVLQKVTEPYLQLELLLAYGGKSLTNNVVLALKGLLDKFDDPAEKAYTSARIIKKLPKMTSPDRNTFLTVVTEGGDALLHADCLIGLASSGALNEGEKEETITKIKELLSSIEEHHPKEAIKTKLVCLEKDKDIETLLTEIDEIESMTLKYHALKAVILAHINETEENYTKMIEKMDDPQFRLCCQLARFKALKLSGVEAVRFLEKQEGDYLEVKQIKPKIHFILTWGSIDPLSATKRVLALSEITDQVEAAAKLAILLKDSDNTLAKRVLNDVYIDMMRSVQFEPIDRAPLVRTLAGSMKAIDADIASEWLKNACAPLIAD